VRFDKVLWLDVESLSLDPKIASIRELSFVAEIEGKQVGEIQSYKVQPVLHMEDKLYGHLDIEDFCRLYNKKFNDKDPDRITTFGFDKSNPLFVHSYSALTFNVPPPDILNPSDWLIGSNIVPSVTVIMELITYLTEHSTKTKGRWVLAGHNIKYDIDVLINWAMRLLGKEHLLLTEHINKFVYLDTLALSRWMQYSGRLKSDRATLGVVAAELGIETKDMHTARADVFAYKEIARILLGGGE
jgi:hypothetical protein